MENASPIRGTYDALWCGVGGVGLFALGPREGFRDPQRGDAEAPCQPQVLLVRPGLPGRWHPLHQRLPPFDPADENMVLGPRPGFRRECGRAMRPGPQGVAKDG